ncbi:MAG TPA: hypothetical protein VGG04_19130 [Candidatus Sulfotelmatobacter sp.]
MAPAVAQKPDAPPQMPPHLPMFSPADLSAKVPAPKPEDVKSIDAIMAAAYAAISGPAGPRNWDRFRSLFLPQARFTQVGKNPDGSTFVISWNEEEFIRDASTIFSKDPFYENGIVNLPQSYGGMTQVFSSYESKRTPDGKPFERGINSFQVLNDGKRWWIVSIFWDSERPDNPLPAKMAGEAPEKK